MTDTTAAPRLTGAAKASRRKACARNRKRKQRASEAKRGRPDLTVLDRAIVDSLRAIFRSAPAGERYSKAVQPEGLILAVAGHLVKRSKRDQAAGRKVVVYRREEVAAAIEDRLFSTPRARRDGALPEA
ncbi:hypothetical protein [Methylobacterium ajmalii]|jgi:hypothetical protein|uniref:hypothetical protein n=1 Tax=Methylobacterium ajmalii TaxID=2738439 RepID=UPI00190E51CE|nr:hypothetical protein [Methylobacterium ajmalii]MBK3398111.1 hypothetical protein [Methylobacterium ajmalii]MBK3406857.1 hypothetical protein [Methylobacterium ajmalii]MBK3420652.1 hypothetical protein [Methylobacterium ajmalii]MBZ6415748.1 hypothetical protein [Methylobacterium sp.]